MSSASPSLILVLLSAAVLTFPPVGSGDLGRLGGTGDVRRSARRVARVPISTLLRAGRTRCALAAALAAFGVGALAGLAVVGLAAAGVAGLAVHLAWMAGDARMRTHEARAALEAVGGLVDELRAGQPTHLALATVASFADPRLGWPLADAARTAALGGDPAAVLRERGDPRLVQVAAGWSLSAAAGCSLAVVLGAVDADLRAGVELDRLRSSQLSGPRATAALLAVLPALGLAMGAAMGARPWHVLTGTGPGQLALLLGVGLDLTGVLWTVRLTRVQTG